MRLDAVTAEIRPRSDWEALDLGFAMVRRDFWRCVVVWWLALGIPTLVAAVILWNYPSLFILLFWWWKPVGSRMVLFEISRRLFGEQPSWRVIWREIPRAWTRRIPYRFLFARFSPWFSVTLAVEALEGLRGKAYKLRCAQVLRRGEGIILWLNFASELAAGWLALGGFLLIITLTPEGQDGSLVEAFESWDPNVPHEIPVLIKRIVAGCLVFGICLTDIFTTGAGFGIYINNRTWLEGWDVELAFKRMAQRLGKVVIIAGLFFIGSASVHADDYKLPAEVIHEVKADEAFKVHTVIDRIPKPDASSSPGWLSADVMGLVGNVFLIVVVAVIVGLVAWLLWKFRHLFMNHVAGKKAIRPAASARVVMGMQVSPETLPANIPALVWQLWQQGKHQEALGLLYRGSISRVIELGQLEIQESDTEGDCMKRVEQAGSTVHPDYFRKITSVWIRMAYGGDGPADAEVQRLCEQWPFGGRQVI